MARLIIYREIDRQAATLFYFRVAGNCLALSEFPADSIVGVDIATAPRIGDLACFGYAGEFDDPNAIIYVKRVAYRNDGRRDVLVYEADGLVHPLGRDLPIAGTVVVAYIPTGAA